MTAKAPKELEPPSIEKNMRADARRNRAILLEGAREAFSKNGVEASLEDIARKAGVGIGTLYRHFPSREDLVEAVYRREVESLCAAADELAEQYPPDTALEEWMQRFVGYIATKRGMANSLRVLVNTNSTLFSESSGLVSVSLQRLLEAAAKEGLIRKDVESTDLLHALASIYSIPDSPEWHERSRRLMKLLMDGLRWNAGEKSAS